jgi:hypothetical protein
MVAALDATTSGWLSYIQFLTIAAAAPVEKQGLLNATVDVTVILRGFSGLSLLLALALAALGPIASVARSRALVRPQVAAIVASMVTAVLVVVFGSSYLIPFTYAK